jgi:hypothetical protein
MSIIAAMAGIVQPAVAQKQPPPRFQDTIRAVAWHTAGTNAVAIDSALTRQGARVVSNDAYFRRMIFDIRADLLGQVSGVGGIESVMKLPEVVGNDDQVVKTIKADQVLRRPFGQITGTSGLRGTNVAIGIFDISRADTSPQFTNLHFLPPFDECPDPAKKKHAMRVTSVLAGQGLTGSPMKYCGVAPNANLYTWSVLDRECAFIFPTTIIRDNLPKTGMVIAQNSWSERPPLDNACEAFGAYNGICMEYDKLVREKNVTVVFSAGNHGCECYRALCQHDGYELVMPPATAKNIIVVGAAGHDGSSTLFSSRGPTADGRLVPHVAAPGVGIFSLGDTVLISFTPADGTSLAAPAVSGACALLVERFQALNPSQPPPALVKAILLNNSTDIGRPGPDYEFGYGMIDVQRSCDAITNSRYVMGSVAKGSESSHDITLNGPCTLKVMLCYSDLEASSATGRQPALVTDLALELVAPNGSTIYHPLKLDPSQPELPAQPDTIPHDNVEQVVVPNAPAGSWKIRVKWTSSTSSLTSQDYAVTWTSICNAVRNSGGKR